MTLHAARSSLPLETPRDLRNIRTILRTIRGLERLSSLAKQVAANSKGDPLMSRFRRYETASYLAPALAFVIIILAADSGNAQSNQPFTFRAGQSMYIVAF